jgi:serine/threonine protein kinase/tetratricopeptide (TPR) repeat protein
MRPSQTGPQGMELDDFILAYEAAWARGEPVDLKSFLPEPAHALYGSVLRELVRVDLEYRWDRGQPRPLEDYRNSFPELFNDGESLHAITFEEYRLRREAGEKATPAEYQRRFGADVSTWPCLDTASAGVESAGLAQPPAGFPEADQGLHSALLAEAAMVYQDWCRDRAGSVDAAGKPSWVGFEGSWEHAELFDELHHADPIVAERLAKAMTAMPRVAAEFLGFGLLAELGRGAFGRVYLARQGELADRLVVLKIVPKLFGESRTLAQLQHTHIVPIYSVHEADDFQVICMPFFGTITLAEILRDLRSRPALPDSGRYLLDRIVAGARERTGTWVSPRSAFGVPPPSNPRAPLEGLTYVNAILWLAARLADGLAHAHARGIVHRDLKPANILLTDEGQPMLLDFNLSADSKLHRSERGARIGGTLPYMSPEQLEALREGNPIGDERSDLYSFGIILRELLTGRPPLARPTGSPEEVLGDLREERRRLPEVRQSNPAVSPGTESIILHCLEPDPSRRYQTARELHEDLQRQLEDRPLRFAPELSLWERSRKWTRRHPRLSSSTSVGVIATVLVLALAGTFLLRVRHLARLRVEQNAQQTRLQAVAALHRLREDLKTIEVLLGSDVHDAEREQREEGMALARAVLDRYGVLELPAWLETASVSALAPEQRQQLREDMGELLLLLAGAAARQDQPDLALRFNALATDCFSTSVIPRALWRQRAELARSIGSAAEAREFEERAKQAKPDAARDRYLFLLTEYRHQGRLPEALPLLHAASRRLNDNFSVWMTLGHCYAELGKPAEAVECYDMAAALWPEALWPYLCRGLACLEQGAYRQAHDAFNEVIRLRPEMPQAYYNRALASYHLGDLPGAQADLTHLLNEPKPPLRAYFLRAKVRSREGDRAGAQRDREEGLRGEPRDERDLTARGLVRQPRDPRAALADYEGALKLNPHYLAALQNKANVLAEDLGRTMEAIGALDQALALYPDYVPARAGRGVLHARLGRREAAHADARETLRRDTKPMTVYQVAGIYALTSRQDPDDRREAFRLLGSALSQGFGLDLLDRDRDLDPIRNQAEFGKLVEAARAHRAGGTPPAAKPRADAKRNRQADNSGEAIALPR